MWYEKLTAEERRAASAEIARRECDEQGIPFQVDDDGLRRLGRNIALWTSAA